MDERLELRDLSVDYGAGAPALDGVDLTVGDGELVTVVGPSGCGKSTLLRVIAGLVRPTRGEVWIDGRRVDHLEPGERDIALVFQSYALYPHMTVRENMEFPLRMRKVPRADRRTRVEEVAALLGLGALLARRPHELSGGQMQRAAIGRALVRRPKLFLLDEPLSNLDTRLAEDVRGELRALFRELRASVVYVTHDQVGAVTLGDRLCVLGRGRVQALGAPLELVARPPSTFVADLLGTPPMNLVRGRVDARVFRADGLTLPAPNQADGDVTLGLAPDELRFGGDSGDGAAGMPCRCRVVDVERTGVRTVARVRLGSAAGSDVRVVLPGDHHLLPGEERSLDHVHAARHWFDGATGSRRG